MAAGVELDNDQPHVVCRRSEMGFKEGACVLIDNSVDKSVRTVCVVDSDSSAI